jgi:hypothetical protein
VCQKATYAAQQRPSLFDHLVGEREQVPVLDSHSSDRSQVRWLAPPAEMMTHASFKVHVITDRGITNFPDFAASSPP